MPRLMKKADDFITSGDLSEDMAKAIVKRIEQERGKQRLVNKADGEAADDDRGRVFEQLTLADMQKELSDCICLHAHVLCKPL